MVIYWSLLLLSGILIVYCNMNYRTVEAYGRIERRAHIFDALLFFSIIILLTGLRGGIADTPTYIQIFNNLPSNLNNLNPDALQRDKGFYILSVIFKQFISNDYHLWLVIIAIISGLSIMYTLYKYSINFGLSIYLFIATCQFTWMLNGMRQFIAVSCLFGFFGWILRGNKWRYIVLVLLLSTIHGSAILMLPIYFIVRQKPWSKRALIPMVLFVFAGIGMEKLPGIFSGLLENTQYSGYISIISNDSGSSFIRVIIATIPVIIAFISKNKLEKHNNKSINIWINMSALNLASLVISTFTSGIFMGRIGIYFDLYNLLLLPWLIRHCFTKENRKIIYIALVGLYVIYFKHQMIDIWSLPYYSDTLGLYFR